MQNLTWKLLICSGAVIVLDQISKQIIRYLFELGKSISLVGDIVRFTYIVNPGMAFGLRLGGTTFFTVFASLASLTILIYFFRLRGNDLWARLALALILGGAIGNLIDRIAFGKVVDFIDIGINSTTRWPIFNVADIAVTAGMIILVTLVIFDKKKKDEEIEEEEKSELSY